MNCFSDKEYQNLRTDTAEIRSCITRYIGYIISITGFSGAFKYFLSDKISAFGGLLLLSFSIISVTFIFEIIWYKFKSHNRFVGYMQLLMQEIDAIPIKGKEVISEQELKDKAYIKNYQHYLDKKSDKGIEDFFSWEFMMSRFNSSNYFRKTEKTLEDDICQSISKCRFVFSISRKLYPFIEVAGNDINFFKKVIFPLYLNKSSKSFLKNILYYICYLYQSETKIILDEIEIEKRYIVSGWRYPKKITQIAFTSILIIYVYFVYSSIKVLCLGDSEINICLFATLLLITSLFFGFWVGKYLRNLKDLIYGKDSIDYYCWMFFVYRTQLLDNRGVIPVFFSSAFIRYFKANLYSKIYHKNYEVLKKNLSDWVSESELTNYVETLTSLKEFNNKQRKIHMVLTKAFNNHYHKLKQTPDDLKIPEDIISIFSIDSFNDSGKE